MIKFGQSKKFFKLFLINFYTNRETDFKICENMYY